MNFFEVPCSIILRWVKWLLRILFKGTVKRDFLRVFFHNSSLPWSLSNGLKYFRFVSRFRRVIRVFWDWLRAVQYHTAQSQVPCSIILHGVTLHSMLSRVNSYSFKLSLRPLKRKCHKNKCGFLFYSTVLTKGYIFYFFTIGLNFFKTSHSIILRGVSIFYTKFRISQRKRNQIRKYFNPLVSGPGWLEWWKKLVVKNLVGLSL